MTHKKDLLHAPDTPLILCCSQYNRYCPVRRVLPAAMLRLGSVPAAPPLSSGAPERPGDTRCARQSSHSLLGWPYFVSSPASGPAPSALNCRHRRGKIPASAAGFAGRILYPQGSLPGDTQRPSPPRPSPGGHRRSCRSQSTAPSAGTPPP